MPSTAPWIIRREPIGSDNPYPWHFTYRPDADACGAGGHYGSMGTLSEALRCIETEWADHTATLTHHHA